MENFEQLVTACEEMEEAGTGKSIYARTKMCITGLNWEVFEVRVMCVCAYVRTLDREESMHAELREQGVCVCVCMRVCVCVCVLDGEKEQGVCQYSSSSSVDGRVSDLLQ